MLEIRTANRNELKEVQNFYYTLIENMQNMEYKPGWKKDIYPTTQFLQNSINDRELLIGEVNGEIAVVVVVNHEFNERYQEVKWPADADPLEITVIHALGVHPDFSGKGLAKEMMQKVFSLAKENHQKVVRLDVLTGNIPAEKLYISLGFQYIDTIQMYYDDTGWADFRLYEYIL